MARILAIDDEKGILDIIKEALSREGHLVTVVSDPINITNQQYGNYDIDL